MCGIAGIFSLRGGASPDPARLAPALAAMAHRGPDGEGVVSLGSGTLGHRRLAVLDRDGGRQPMLTPDGAAAIAANGEIYQHEHLRAALTREGARFSTRSDTEVLLQLLTRDGEAALPRLSGMFGLALLEHGGERLLLARDAFGVKPLFWRHDEKAGELRFASEPGALLALGGETPRLDLDALLTRLAFQVPLSDRTLVRGVRSLPPGTSLRASAGGFAIRTWHDVRFRPAEEVGEEVWAERLATALDRAVAGALRADVPLGVTLSGGLDSTLVAALAARYAGEGLEAYTGYFEEGPAYDERRYAREAARELGLRLTEVPTRPEDLISHLPELARALDGPLAGPGSLPELVVAGRAAEDVTVILSGQGADETFGGYARHRIAWLAERGELDPERLPADLLPYEPLVRHLLSGGAGSMSGRFFRLVHRGDGLSSLLGRELREAWRGYDARAEFDGVFREEDGDLFHRMVSYERRTLLPALLAVEDRVSMLRSLESRVPLLDPEVVALSARIPTSVAFRDGELKGILRRAARGIVPEVVLGRRDKMGFPVPLARWAAGPLREPLLRLLASGPLVDLGILAPDGPPRLLDTAGAHGRHLWFFLLLSEWMKGTGVRL